MAVKFEKRTALSSLSITPMIDIVFLLLIFFLVATRFADEDRELDVSLPSAAEAKPLIVKPQEMFLNIDMEGRFFLNSKVMNVQQMRQFLKQAAVNNPANQTVIIRADRKCDWDHVVMAIDACHRAGIRDVRPTTAVARN